uniref:BEN domain-containing protein n=1 Tax=Anopheles minimus TaxID=112268 RepID=A0A182WH42_9DIPT
MTGSSPCWALIEWETLNEEPSSYTVIESSQIVEISRETERSEEDSGQRMRDSGLYTGKLIHVLRGRYIMSATIVIISEDRQFLETELHELRMMAANNLIAKSATQTQLNRKPTLKHYGRSSQSVAMQTQQGPIEITHEIVNTAKRQRCDSGPPNSSKEIESRVSSVSTPDAVKTEAGMPYNAEFSHQKTLPPVRPMVARFNRKDPVPKQAPPMTFDQQTQTTDIPSVGAASYDANFVRIVSYLESIMAEQKGYRMETEYNRRLLHELQEKILDQHEMVRNVQKQMAELKHFRSSKISKSQTNQYSPEPGVGTNAMVIDTYETTNDDHIVLSGGTDSNEQWDTKQELVVEERQPSNSNQSWMFSHHTSIPIDDHATRSSTTPQSMDSSSRLASESPMFIELENDGQTIDADMKQTRSNATTATVHELINNDWDDTVQENESNNNQRNMETTTIPNTTMIAIGSNNTMVPKTVLDNIPWVSYKFATRKVLQAVFPREVLATHSLSGRPCPAHASNAEKPVKGRLDPKMVADVIELIRKKFNVDESNVRAVITNKCADENKMVRLKNDSARQGKRAVKSSNKENVSSGISAEGGN